MQNNGRAKSIVLNEEQEKLSDEDMEVPQCGSRCCSTTCHCWEEKGLSGDSSIAPLNSAKDEMYEEKEETPVDMIKDKAKGDFNPVILSKETLDLEDDETEEKPELPKRKLKN
ncbi:hypothetical protein TNCV_108701 [Trichonephila clavipes]|nr:hypothetical protein TNCV_108701 [Trichonephila clavipes]